MNIKRFLVLLTAIGAFALPVAPVAAGTTFPNCSAAEAAGRTDIPRGDPAYAPRLDRDGDGVACESGSGGGDGGDGGNGGGDTSGDSEARLPKTGGDNTTTVGIAAAAMVALGIPLAGYRRRRQARR